MSDALKVSLGDGTLRINVELPMARGAAETVARLGRGLNDTAGRTAPSNQTEIPGSLRHDARLGIWHTPNFAVVRWGDETFAFTPTQARVVAALVTASRRGFEWLDQETLLAEAQSEGDRLLPLFRGHPAWNRWIVSATPISERPATWRLADAI